MLQKKSVIRLEPPAAMAAARMGRTAPRLVVDLAAIRANHLALRRRYRGSILSAVLKSDAYCLGMEPIAEVLEQGGCRDFWVNDLDEAARLRAMRPAIRIHCLMGLAGGRIRDFETVSAIPALNSPEEIATCADHAEETGRRVPVTIQLDTGLGRLGLGPGDVEHLADRSDLLRGLDILAYVSHLSAYNLPDAPRNLEQHREMRRLCALLPPAPISLGASSAVFMESGWHFDMARVGSGLFGVQTSVRFQDGLQPCYALEAPVISITQHPAGRRIGYRGATELHRRSRIATVAIGYANGLPQSFADFGTARLHGKQVQIVGGIAMNMTMIDVTDLPDDWPQVGDRAIFLDAEQPIEPVAERIGCAPNVLLTQIGAGTRKEYVGA